MDQFASPAVLPATVESPQESFFWGTPLEFTTWFCLIVLVTYLSFGVGILACVTGVLLFFKLCEAKACEFPPKTRSFFAKLVITGVAYQFMGFALISSNHIVDTDRFFRDAGVDYSRVKLVDTMNYRSAITEVELAGDEFEKLTVFYREQAQAAIDVEAEDKWNRPEGFTYFELASNSVDTTLLESLDHACLKLKPLLIGYEQNDGWGNEKRGTHVFMDEQLIVRNLKDIIEAFPKIDHSDYGPGRVIVWDNGYGSLRFLIWFPKHRRGFLKCRAAFG